LYTISLHFARKIFIAKRFPSFARERWEPLAVRRVLFLHKRLAVGALFLLRIRLMRADLNAVQTAIILAVAMIYTVRHGATDAVIRLIHSTISFLPDWSADQLQYCRKVSRLYVAQR
jgi:hypothetical protein